MDRMKSTAVRNILCLKLPVPSEDPNRVAGLSEEAVPRKEKCKKVSKKIQSLTTAKKLKRPTFFGFKIDLTKSSESLLIYGVSRVFECQLAKGSTMPLNPYLTSIFGTFTMFTGEAF